jgi:hypothetical protein
MVKNVFRLGNSLVVTMDNGKEYRTNSCNDEFYEKVTKAIKNGCNLDDIFFPSNKEKLQLKEKIENSSIITVEGNSAYIPSISKLSLPKILVDKILEAEGNNKIDAVTAYKNFWTLLSLNPNSRVRDNLFWFLDKWGMSICKSGLFVAYRNVELKTEGLEYNKELTSYVSEKYYYVKNNINKNPSNYYVIIVPDKGYDITDKEGDNDVIYIGNLEELYKNIVYCSNEAGTVYTDNYTKKMIIRLGHIVNIPRSKCDENVETTCSSGLHVGGKGWLKHNYCGNIGLKVLVNPADVCSCPKMDNYGKLRTCAYYPIQVIGFDDNDNVIDDTIQDGFEVDFINKIRYKGTINNEDIDNYELNLPKDDSENIYKNLKNIALSINRRV